MTAAVLTVTCSPKRYEQLLEWNWCDAVNTNHRYTMKSLFWTAVKADEFMKKSVQKMMMLSAQVQASTSSLIVSSA
jgi:hypothetical protein